ncbi:MAG TPA: DNA polymerase III subunit delta [Deltaproteobacteria bacterium]|nr:DNA polymerase III subunit delta [Deltaproteobacteria bacterium]
MSLSLLKSASHLPLDPVVAMIGPEAFLRRALRENLTGRALAGALREMNFSEFQAGEDDMRRLVEACQDYPCFASRRVVVLRDAGLLKAKAAETLSAYLDNPQPTTLLLIDSEKLDGRLEWVKKLKKKSHWVELETCDRSDQLRWVRETFQAESKNFEAHVDERIVDWIGASLEALQLAVRQCCLYAGDAALVKMADVEDLLVKITEENVFEVIEALFEGNFAKLHHSLDALLETGEEPLKILSLLHRHLSILLTIRFSGLKKAGSMFRMPPLAWRKYERQAERFGKKLTLSLWAPLTRADLRLKGSSLPRPLLLKNCVGEIIALLR